VDRDGQDASEAVVRATHTNGPGEISRRGRS
jgi:hypothetical protein